MTGPMTISFPSCPNLSSLFKNIAFAAEFAAGLATNGRAMFNNNTSEDESASFGRCEAAVDKVGKKIAKEMPNYAAEAKDDTDAADEMDAIRNELQMARAWKDMKDIGLCKRIVVSVLRNMSRKAMKKLLPAEEG